MNEYFCLSCGSDELERGYNGVYECRDCECMMDESDFEFYSDL